MTDAISLLDSSSDEDEDLIVQPAEKKQSLLDSSSDEDEDEDLIVLPAAKKQSLLDLSSDEDEDLIVQPAVKKQKSSVASSNVASVAYSYLDFSSDDSDIPTESIFSKPLPLNQRKQQDKEVKTIEKERQRQVATDNRQRLAALKDKEKKDRELKKKRDKEERDMVKDALRQENRDRKVAAQQSTGKFAHQEIGLVVHPQFKQAFSKEMLEVLHETYPEMQESMSSRIDNNKGAIQFIRRDHLAGGAKAAMQAFKSSRGDTTCTGYQLVNRLLVVFSDPNDFLKLLQRSDTEDDYPRLEEWLEEINASWKTNWNTTTTPKVMILLPGILEEVHRLWNAASRDQRCALATDADINDAVVWLHVAFRVECQVMKAGETQVLEFLLKMTRAISEEPYIQQVTELDCVKKIKSTVSSQAAPLERAQDAWIRMLQQIPRMSATRAEQLAQFYPTARSLWQSYQEVPKEQQHMMVAHLFGERGQLKKLSEQLCKAMTSNNPNELLS